MSAREITDASFEAEVLACERPVLVDFWAPWCGPCRMMAPMIDEIAATYDAVLKVTKMNVADNPATAEAYDIRSVPTLAVVVERRVVKTIAGAKTKAALLRELASFVQAA